MAVVWIPGNTLPIGSTKSVFLALVTFVMKVLLVQCGALGEIY